MADDKQTKDQSPSRKDAPKVIYRMLLPGPELRAGDGEELPTLFGHMAVFNQWAEINSLWEGNFMERVSQSAFTKTIRENREQIRSLFQHGRDPQVGNKPLGPFDELRADSTGLYFEVPLLDTSYNRDLVPGLEAGLYGSSYQFTVTKDAWDKEPKRSAYNPKGIPERTILEARVFEGGPVTFPAFAGAKAGVRSITDFMLDEDAEHRTPDDPSRFDHSDEGAASPAEEAGSTTSTGMSKNARERVLTLAGVFK